MESGEKRDIVLIMEDSKALAGILRAGIMGNYGHLLSVELVDDYDDALDLLALIHSQVLIVIADKTIEKDGKKDPEAGGNLLMAANNLEIPHLIFFSGEMRGMQLEIDRNELRGRVIAVLKGSEEGEVKLYQLIGSIIGAEASKI